MADVLIIGFDEMRASAFEFNIYHSELSLEELKLIFEVYNRMFDSYQKTSQDIDYSYLKLKTLEGHLQKAKTLHLKQYQSNKNLYSKGSKAFNSYDYFNAINDGRYDLIKDYFSDHAEFKVGDSLKEIIYDYSYTIETYHYIDEQSVDDEVWDGYLYQGFYHYYEIMELYESYPINDDFKFSDFVQKDDFIDLIDLSQGF